MLVRVRIFIVSAPGLPPTPRKTPLATPTLTMQPTEVAGVLTLLAGDKFHRPATAARPALEACVSNCVGAQAAADIFSLARSRRRCSEQRPDMFEICERVHIRAGHLERIRDRDRHGVFERAQLLELLALLEAAARQLRKAQERRNAVGIKAAMTPRAAEVRLCPEACGRSVAIPGNGRTAEVERKPVTVGDHLDDVGIEQLIERCEGRSEG